MNNYRNNNIIILGKITLTILNTDIKYFIYKTNHDLIIKKILKNTNIFFCSLFELGNLYKLCTITHIAKLCFLNILKISWKIIDILQTSFNHHLIFCMCFKNVFWPEKIVIKTFCNGFQNIFLIIFKIFLNRCFQNIFL